MEVVLDVNVFVSAVLSGAGPSAQLVAAMRDDRLSVVACPGLLAELDDVLRRDRFRRFLSLEEVECTPPSSVWHPGGRLKPC